MTKSTGRGPGSTLVKPLFGPARHRQQVRQGWSAERHKDQSGPARVTQRRVKKK
jgi:hypothetical protein